MVLLYRSSEWLLGHWYRVTKVCRLLLYSYQSLAHIAGVSHSLPRIWEKVLARTSVGSDVQRGLSFNVRHSHTCCWCFLDGCKGTLVVYYDVAIELLRYSECLPRHCYAAAKSVLSGCQFIALQSLGCSDWLLACCYTVAKVSWIVTSALLCGF